MNTRKFSDAISEVDDKYYEEAANYQSRRKKNTWIACGSIAAMLAIMVYAGTRFLPQKAPETAAERPMLTISENASDGMGFESYRAYDISELVNANPWNDSLDISTLPVYHNPLTYDKNFIASGADFDKMHELLLEVADRLGLDSEKLDITDDAPDKETRKMITESFEIAGKKVPEGYFNPTKLLAEENGFRIEVDQTMTATIFFDPAQSLPEKYHFTYHSSYEDILSTAEYLKQKYKDLIGIDNPQINVYGGNYNDQLEQTYSIEFFDANGSETEQILNYNFNRIAFYCDDSGNLFIARIHQPDLSQKAGDYPIITSEKAEELLASGHYITNVPDEMPGLEYVRKVELVYHSETYDAYFMPYYCFYVELPEKEEHGLKTYGAYYVPAVRGDYISNMPTWNGDFN